VVKKLHFAVLTVLSLVLTAGCAHSQVPLAPPSYTCPVPNMTTPNYPPLVAAPPYGTTLTYLDNKPGTGHYCYIVQTYDPSTQQYSVASNVATATVVNATQSVTLTWNAPTTNLPATPQYVVSRTTATLNPIPGPPGLNTTPGVALLFDPLKMQLVASITPER